MNLRLVLVLVACLPLAAGAQTIYRCGTNEYTRVPCPDGRPLDLGDSRSAAQRAEARRVLAEEEKRAKEMERERKRNEAAVKPAAAGSLSPPRPAASAASAPKKPQATKKRRRKADADDARDFVATVPAAPKKASSGP